MYIQSNLSDSLRKKRRKKNLFKFIFGVFLVFFIFANFCYISNSEILQIKETKIFNNSAVSSSEIQNFIEDILSEKMFFLISNRNFLFVPKEKISEKILNSFLRLESAKVFLINKDVLAVEVSEREIKAKWCDDEVDNKLKCFFLDKNGILFAQTPDKFGDNLITFIGKIDGRENLGSMYLTEKDFSEIIFFCDSLNKMGLTVVSFASKDGVFKITLRGGGLLYLNERDNLFDILDNVKSLVDGGTIEINDTFLNKLGHLDLRYGNKVHFDFK